MRYFSSADEDSDEYGTKKKPKAMKKRRKVATESVLQATEIRFSTRRAAAAVANYNEDDDDEFEEQYAEEDNGEEQYQAEEVLSGIDLVIGHRIREGFGMRHAALSVVS